MLVPCLTLTLQLYNPPIHATTGTQDYQVSEFTHAATVIDVYLYHYMCLALISLQDEYRLFNVLLRVVWLIAIEMMKM